MLTPNQTKLATFFNSFSGFEYDPNHTPQYEWKRLRQIKGWPKPRNREDKHPQRDKAYMRFRKAMTETFNDVFGQDAESTDAWYRLCFAAGIVDIPETKAERQRVMLATHVNLCDLMKAGIKGGAIPVFANVNDLREYTLSQGKIFPKEDAYAGGLLKFLLREITGTYNGKRHVKKGRARR